MTDLKVNKSDIKKRLDGKLTKGVTDDVLSCDLIAKCYLYLCDKENSKKYYDLSIKDIQKIIVELKSQGNEMFYIKRQLDLANYKRILGKEEIMKNILHEIEPIYRSLCTGDIKENPRNRYADFYFEWSTVNFHLGNYKEAYEIGKQCYKDHMPISPRQYAKGLLEGDNSIIEKEIDDLVNFIKSDRWKPYSSPINVIDPWEWYEIGRQILGMPSILDLFKGD